MTDKKARWVIPLIAAIIVLVISSIFLVVDAQAPALRVNGSSAVNPGETLHVHGTGFLPGGWVTLKLEDGEVLSPNSGLGQTEHNTGSGVEAANALQMLAAGQLSQETASNSAILVNNVGAFDTNIVVREDWGLGPHTIHATEEGARSADLQFTITAKSARLVVNSNTLDFGSIHQGKKVFLAEMLGNTGGQRLTWTADSKGTTWLIPQPHMGAIAPGSLQQPLYVAADTSNLQAGNYTATLRLSSNGGEKQLAVKLTVIAGGGQQVRLKVIPGSLDFGMQTKGAQTTLQAVVSNLGTQVLNWKVSAGNTKWLALDKHAGTIEPGGLPQTIYITADTSKLSARTYPATLQFSSNGGSVMLGVKIVVTLPPPIPPSPNPVPVAPKLKVSPSSLDGNNNCSYAQGQGWTCVTMLSNRLDATSSLNWSASASGIPGITFYPASGVLPPGQFVQVNALIPETTCPASATFTFMGPASTIPVSWRCSPIPPTLTLSPLGFNASTDCSFGGFGRNSGWTCLATLISSGNKSNINWTASASGLPGIAFLPNKGTLAPGAPTWVTIIIPSTTCPANATFTFLGAAKAVTVPWSCAAPKLAISPESLTNGCLSCTVTLALDANSPGNVNWKASAFGLSGITFRPSQGTLSPGRSVQVIISLPNTTCPASATFSFSGTVNSFNVPWHCAPGESQLTVSPTTLIAGSSDCPSSGNGWTCTAILAPSAGSQSAILWSASSNLHRANFSLTNGTLSPGQQTQVNISIPKSACHMSSFSFAGPANTISVPWSCAKPPRLRLGSSNKIDANRDCTGGQGQVWNCSFALTGDPDNQSGANWSASSSNTQSFFSPSSGIQTSPLSSYDNSSNPSVFFSPSSGSIAPGQTEVVNMTFSSNCPNQTDLVFTELDTGDQSLVPWSCTSPPAITASPDNFTANSSICPAENGGWTCTTTLSASGSASSLNWSASSNLQGAIFTPSSGMLSTGQSGQQVSIFIPSGDCQNGAFSFMGPANTVTSQWSCTPPPKLEASLGNCSYTVQGWACSATVSGDSNNQVPLDWSVQSNGLSNITFSPPGGTLNPGQQVQVAIAIPDTICPASSTFTFSSSAKGSTPASITWNCVAPSMMISSGGTCPDNGSGAYTCTMTLSLDNGSQGDLNWSVSGPSGVTFDHSSGKLVPGAQQQVTASVPASDCSVDSFTFTDNAGNIYTSSWSCAIATATPTPTSTATSIATDTATPTTGTTVTPTDTPTATATTGTPTGTPTGSPTATPTPTIQVSPTSFDSSTCTWNSSNGSWTCTATLSLVSGVSSNVSWNATSSFTDVTFNPNSNTLTPGTPETVAITVPATDCTSGTFTFTPDTGSPTTAPWTCSGTPTPTATNTPTPTTGVTPTDTPTPGVTPTDTPTPGVTPTDTPTPTPTPGVTPTDTPTPTPGVTPTDTPTPTPGVTPTDTPTPTPGITPTPTSTSTAAATPNRPKPSSAWTPTPIDRPALIHRHRFLDAYFDG